MNKYPRKGTEQEIKERRFAAYITRVDNNLKPFVRNVENCDFEDAEKEFVVMDEKQKYTALDTCFYGDLFPYVFVNHLLKENDNVENRLLAIYTAIRAMQTNSDHYNLVEQQIEALKKMDPTNKMLMRYIVMVYDFQKKSMKGIQMFTREELTEATESVLKETPDDMNALEIKKELDELKIIDGLKVNPKVEPIPVKYLNRR